MDIQSLDALTVIILYGLIYIVECNDFKKSQDLLYPSDKSFDYALALNNFYNNPLVTKGESGATYEYFDYLQHDYSNTNTIRIESNPIDKFLSSKDYGVSANLQSIVRRTIGMDSELIGGDNGSEKNEKGTQQGITITGVKVL